MKNLVGNTYTQLIFRLVLSAVFIFAGIEKIANPELFAESITNYRILPIEVVNFFAVTLPWLEVFCGILLLFGIAVKENSFILNVLLCIFISLILVSIIRGLDIDCGCFGTMDGQKVGLIKILENTILLLMGLTISKFSDNQISLDTPRNT